MENSGIRIEGGDGRVPLVPKHGGGSIWLVVAATAVAVAGSFEFGCAVGYSSPAQSGIVNELGLSLAEYAVFGSILTIGAMVGAVVSGSIADYLGRRCAMGISDVFCIGGWLAMYFSKDAWILDLGRFSVGCGMGLFSYVVPVYIAEITPKDIRGAFTAVNQGIADDMLWCFPFLPHRGAGYLEDSCSNWNYSMCVTTSRPCPYPRVSKLAGKSRSS